MLLSDWPPESGVYDYIIITEWGESNANTMLFSAQFVVCQAGKSYGSPIGKLYRLLLEAVGWARPDPAHQTSGDGQPGSACGSAMQLPANAHFLRSGMSPLVGHVNGTNPAVILPKPLRMFAGRLTRAYSEFSGQYAGHTCSPFLKVRRFTLQPPSQVSSRVRTYPHIRVGGAR